MKVLRVAHHGVVSAWRQRERILRARGDAVELFAAHRWNEGGRDLVLSPGHDTFVHGVGTVGTHPNAFLYNPLPIWRALGRHPDILDLHEEPFSLATAEILALRALRGSRVPYLLYSAQNIHKTYPVPFRWFESYALRHAKGAYVCNRQAGEILVRKGLRAVPTLIPLGVDISAFSPASRSTPTTRPVIGYVGRLEPHKGVSTLLRAAASHPTWEIRITGEGRDQASLESLATELGIRDRVRFLGFTDDEALARRYRELDVIAIPSLPTPGWLEQFCRVAVEAMASGVPVVASRSGAIPDVIGDAGILVQPGDADALGEGVSRALDAPEWLRLRARGIHHSSRFTWDNVAAQHSALYRSAARARHAGRDLSPQVVVVAYGSPEMLDDALTALRGELPVTIVDNSSSASTRAVADHHGAHYIDSGANIGFGAGVNIALRSLSERGLAESDVLLYNPDARVDPSSVGVMHSRLHSRDDLAAVGATQRDPATGAAARVWWPFPHPIRAWVEALGLGRLNRAHGFAIGSVLLLRSEAIADVGVFDERFFLYAEEADWQKRAVDHGWNIDVAEVDAEHVGAATSSNSTHRDHLFHASAEKYQRKHFGAAGWQAYRGAMILGAATRSLVLPNGRRRAARERLSLYVHGPVSSLDS